MLLEFTTKASECLLYIPAYKRGNKGPLALKWGKIRPMQLIKDIQRYERAGRTATFHK